MVLPLIAGIGLGLAAIGTGISIFGASEQNDAQKQMIAAQQQAQRIRRQAMELDARRRTLEAVRMGQRARAQALATATAQGAGAGSGIQGGFGQISGATGFNLLGISQNLEFGQRTFRADAALSQARLDYADASSLYQLGGSITSLGGALIANLPTLGNIFGGTGQSQ